MAEMILNDPDTLFPNSDTHIVGPSCYPLLPNLMTPFSDDTNNTVSQNIYNDAIQIPLNIIKLAFGKLLGRFKRLMYVSSLIPSHNPTLIIKGLIFVIFYKTQVLRFMGTRQICHTNICCQLLT